MNLTALLTKTELSLHPGVIARRPDGSKVEIAHAPGHPRITLTREQMAWLRESFEERRTVPHALAILLGRERHLRFREFFGLVVLAHAAGVLVGDPEVRSSTRVFPVKLPPSAAGQIFGFLSAVAIVAAFFGHLPTGADVLSLAIGWLGVCLALSLGHVFSASLLAAKELPAEHASVKWLTLFPHWNIDALEAEMDGPALLRSVSFALVAPLLLSVALAAHLLPGALPTLLAGLLYALRPWGESATMTFLRSLEQPESTLSEVPLPARTEATDDVTDSPAPSRFGPLSWRQGLASFFWMLAVVVLSAAIASHLAGKPMFFGLTPTTLVGGVSTLWLVLVIAATGAWGIQRARTYLKSRARSSNRAAAISPLSRLEAIEVNQPSDLRKFLLLSGLDDATLAALHDTLQHADFAADTNVFAEDEPADAFYLVTSGRFEVRKNGPAGKNSARTIGVLRAGDCFGEIALLEQTSRTATVRALSSGTCLRLTRHDFESLIVARVGAARLRELLQNVVFLGRLAHCAGWSAEEILGFAQRAKHVECSPGQIQLRANSTNHFFYLVYDGAFEVRMQGKTIRTLGPGDHFGEMSLLAHGYASADVVATEPSRCLALFRDDFLEFFCRDFRVALEINAQIERIAQN